MEYGAIDVHLRHSQIRILNDDESVVFEARIETTRAGLTWAFEGRAPLRILLESGTDSEWVAQHLEGLGHEVIVADPNYAAMYGARSRRVKTDKRDVAALALACRRGIYRRAHRVPARTRALRQTLRIRRQLVQVRTGLISVLRAVLRQEGWRLRSGSADRVVTRLDALELSADLQARLAPVRASVLAITEQLVALGEALSERATVDPIAQRLMSAPGVGDILALTFQSVVDDPARFGGDAGRLSAYLGLVPREQSSGERQHRGHITKAGSGEMRSLLVQASWVIWRGQGKAGLELRRWVHALAARRGRRVAIVALARRLARILYAMWRDATEFRVRREPLAEATR